MHAREHHPGNDDVALLDELMDLAVILAECARHFGDVVDELCMAAPHRAERPAKRDIRVKDLRDDREISEVPDLAAEPPRHSDHGLVVTNVDGSAPNPEAFSNSSPSWCAAPGSLRSGCSTIFATATPLRQFHGRRTRQGALAARRTRGRRRDAGDLRARHAG